MQHGVKQLKEIDFLLIIDFHQEEGTVQEEQTLERPQQSTSHEKGEERLDKAQLKNTPHNFKGGKVGLELEQWKKFTSDKWILEQIEGVKLIFIQDKDMVKDKKEIQFSKEEDILVKAEVDKLIEKAVIKRTEFDEEQILSNIFLREKKDGSYRMILNLKNVNKNIDKIHFKMDTINNAIALMRENCFFASLDLKDAYFSVSIHPEFRKFFRFLFHGELFEFMALPQDFRDSPRIFTKILKPILSYLRSVAIDIIMFIDDSLILADSISECRDNVAVSCEILDTLGFTIHPDKSVFERQQEIEFLGFILNSVTMTVSLPYRKIMNIQ